MTLPLIQGYWSQDQNQTFRVARALRPGRRLVVTVGSAPTRAMRSGRDS